MQYSIFEPKEKLTDFDIKVMKLATELMKPARDIYFLVLQDEILWMTTAIRVNELEIAAMHAEKILNCINTLNK